MHYIKGVKIKMENYPKKTRRIKKMAAIAGDPEFIIIYIRSLQPSKVID